MYSFVSNIAKISRQNSNEVNSSKVIGDICLALTKSLDLDDLVLYLLSNEDSLEQHISVYRKKDSFSLLKSPQSLKLKFGQGVVGLAAQTKMNRRINDVSKCPEYVPGVPGSITELTVPIVHKGNVIGVIDSESTKSNYFTNTHIDIFQIVSSVLTPYTLDLSKRKNSSANTRYEEFLYLLKEKELFLNHDATQSSISSILGISPQYLAKVIKENSARSFSEIVNQLRVEKAISLFTDSSFSNCSIQEIFYEVGYSSKSSFNREFKKQTGLTPSVYRQQLHL